MIASVAVDYHVAQVVDGTKVASSVETCEGKYHRAAVATAGGSRTCQRPRDPRANGTQ